MINFQVKLIALSMNANTCESECTEIGGHLPYTFEA